MRKPANMGASVRARLLDLARQRRQSFQSLLTRFVLERLLSVLLTSWFTDPLRPTQDLDLLG